MKKLILFILGAISALTTTLAQQPELESPIYIGVLIIEMSDTAWMARTCRDYGLTELPVRADGYHSFRYHDGTTISFTVAPDADHAEMLPIVEIRTNESTSSIKKILEQTCFVRSSKASNPDGSTSRHYGKTSGHDGKTYERGNKFTSRWTRATLTPNRLLLTRHLPTSVG